MSHVEAIYRGGVFEPLGPVNLREEQRVQLSIEPAAEETAEAWLERVQAVQRGVRQREGNLPDSTLDIAQDRTR